MYHVVLLHVTFQDQFDVISKDSMSTPPFHTHDVIEDDGVIRLLISSSFWDFMNVEL